MKNTGYLIKGNEHGYIVEFFSMNSQTFEVNIIEMMGPYATKEEASQAETEHRWSREV